MINRVVKAIETDRADDEREEHGERGDVFVGLHQGTRAVTPGGHAHARRGAVLVRGTHGRRGGLERGIDGREGRQSRSTGPVRASSGTRRTRSNSTSSSSAAASFSFSSMERISSRLDSLVTNDGMAEVGWP